jgi:hypothetical protein
MSSDPTTPADYLAQLTSQFKQEQERIHSQSTPDPKNGITLGYLAADQVEFYQHHLVCEIYNLTHPRITNRKKKPNAKPKSSRTQAVS